MYQTTGDERYHTDLMNLLKNGFMHGYGWMDVGSFGNIAYLSTHQYPTDEVLKKNMEHSMVEFANMLTERIKRDSYGYSLHEFEWGSNMYVANNACILNDAYRITGDEKYLTAVREQIHYLLGKNANATCFVTGFGTLSPKNPHHRPSAARHRAMRGMLVGGPDEGFHDACTLEKLKDVPPARVYADEQDSYSTNEVTIYWNSALLLALSTI